MANELAEKYLARTIGLGSLLTTIVVFTGGVTDPVNVTKLFVLGVVSLIGLGLLLGTKGYQQFNEIKFVVTQILLFLSFSAVAVLFSKSPLQQNIYGTYGRNTGFLAYFFLSLIFLLSVILRNQESFKYILKMIIWAGGVNLVYCLWVILFGDFLSWSNPYGGILGTFGNPNFIGAFLGIFISIFLALILDNKCSKLLRLSAIAVIPICFLEIVRSHAIQGRVVVAAGFSIVFFMYLKPKVNKVWLSIYSFSVLFIGTVSLLGALQIGPLTRFIYKYSISLRGQYWIAAWNAGNSRPFSGVGMDSFGDVYRRSRDAHALEVPGVNTVTNAAHNVPLDLFAFGGWPLFLAYFSIVLFSGISLLRLAKRISKYDSVYTGILVGWFGYQLQSIISINQIGLAIWGWVFMGIAIAYDFATRKDSKASSENLQKITKSKRANQDQKASLVLYGFIGGLVGMLLALPPLASDAKLRTAQLSRSATIVGSTMDYSYFNPQSNAKYGQNIQLFETSGLYDLSHRYAKEYIKWNPQSFDSWKILYFIKNSTPEEKAQSLIKMKELDPLNESLNQN